MEVVAERPASSPVLFGLTDKEYAFSLGKLLGHPFTWLIVFLAVAGTACSAAAWLFHRRLHREGYY
jgi:hypothetical protein